MKFKFLLPLSLICILSFGTFSFVQGQSKEELQELLNSPSNTKSKSSKWDKPKKKKTEQAPQVQQEPKEEKKVVEKKEEPKPAPVVVEKKEEPKAEPEKEVVKEEPKKEEAKPAPAAVVVKEEPKPAQQPAATKKEEPKTEPKKEAKKEEPKKEVAKEEPKKEVKKEEVKPAPAAAKKEEPKPAQPAASKKEQPKAEPKKEEAKPVQQQAAKKEEPKKEVAKEEQKPAPVVVEKKPEPVPAPKPVEVKENLQPEKAKEGSSTASGQQMQGDKLKELPEPDKVGWRKDKRLGKKLFKQGSVYNSLRYYSSALGKKPTKTKLNQPLADESFIVRDYVSANSYYKRLVDADSLKHKNLAALYQYALTDKYLGNYEQAKANFIKFGKLSGDNEKLDAIRKSAGREAQGCDLGISLRDNKDLPEYKATILGDNINQQFTDYAPAMRGDNTLYYGSWTSDRVMVVNKHERYADFSRIYFSKKSGGIWSKGQQVAGGVNDVNFHVGNATFSADGNTMYYTQCAQDEAQRMRCNIYKSTLTDGAWSAGDKLNDNVNAEGFTSTHPALGKNEAGEDVLYFSSDRNVERGMDLFAAKINADGSFAKARTLGSINTKGDDVTPSYDFKTGTLYFSSNGRINIGGMDVYKTNAHGGEWSEPVHMGAPINSSVDDMYYNWSEKNGAGFVVSNRTGGLGLKSATCCDDIYQVEKSRLYFAVQGTVQNADSNLKPINNALVSLYSVSEGKELKSAYAANGQYFFDLEKETEYQLIARKSGFEDLMQGVSTMGKHINDTVTLDLPMKVIPPPPFGVGSKVGTVYWEFNKDYLTDGSPDTLNKVVNFMTGNEQFILEVGSHTDSKGTDEYNMKLSQRRSDAVLKYLASKKISKSRLQSKAYGESKPVELNENPPGTDNPEGRTKNRRTEFVISYEMTPEQMEQAKKDEEAGKVPGKKAPIQKDTKPAEKK